MNQPADHGRSISTRMWIVSSNRSGRRKGAAYSWAIIRMFAGAVAALHRPAGPVACGARAESSAANRCRVSHLSRILEKPRATSLRCPVVEWRNAPLSIGGRAAGPVRGPAGFAGGLVASAALCSEGHRSYTV